MGLSAGTIIDPATTLGNTGGLLDLVFSNRSASLPATAAVFTVLEPHRIVVSWPGGTNDVIYMTFAARPTPPEVITF